MPPTRLHRMSIRPNSASPASRDRERFLALADIGAVRDDARRAAQFPCGLLQPRSGNIRQDQARAFRRERRAIAAPIGPAPVINAVCLQAAYAEVSRPKPPRALPA